MSSNSKLKKALSRTEKIEPPPSYGIAISDEEPPLGHICWMNDSKPPTYAQSANDYAYVRRKLVIVGPGAVGKTCALIVFSKGTFPEVYVPTVFDNYVADLEVDSVHVELALFDTAGQSDYDRLRPLSYPDSHVIVISYAIDSPASLNEVQECWIDEVSHFCQGIPIVLAGLKADMRNDEKTVKELRKTRGAIVQFKDGFTVAKQIGAAAYVECSAKTGEGIRGVYEAATKLSLNTHLRQSKDHRCVVM